MISLAEVLDYIGCATFAMVGAVAARDRKLDLVSCALLGTVAGIGGGTVRDVLIDRPVFWVVNPIYLLVCVGAAAMIWYLGAGRRRRGVLLYLDAVGISAFAVVGALKATTAGLSPPVAIVMGMLTATCGGVLRDVLAADPPVLTRRDVYITVALVAAALFVLGLRLGVPTAVAAGVAATIGSALRILAITRRWHLPEPH